MHGAALKIRLAAPPVEGKANEALLRYIAVRLGLRLPEVKLVRGETSRQKTVRVPASADPQALLDR